MIKRTINKLIIPFHSFKVLLVITFKTTVVPLDKYPLKKYVQLTLLILFEVGVLKFCDDDSSN